jgi:hypothetical protein
MPSRNRHREHRRVVDGSAPRADASVASASAPLSASPVLRVALAGPDRALRPEQVPSGVRRITGPEDAVNLAALILDPDRTHPVAVISIPSAGTEPWIDAAAIAEATQGIAEVVVLPTDVSSWRFSESLPEMTQVYGGAGRVYPVGLDWTTDPYRSPLRFAYGPQDAERATDQLISDALTMSRAAGAVPDQHATVAVHGTVAMLVPPSRAVVRLNDGSLATIWPELTIPEVPLGQLLAQGQAVSGSLDPQTRRLDVTKQLSSGRATVAHYLPGDVVLAAVKQVRRDVVHLALHPDVIVSVPLDRVTRNPKDTLSDLFTGGETVLARVAWLDDKGPALRLDDIDEDDEALPAPALLDGGPPWLVPPEYPEESGDPDQTTVKSVVVAPPAVPAATAARASEAALVSGAKPGPAAATPNATRSLGRTLDGARADVSRLETDLHNVAMQLAATAAERDIFLHQVQWLSEERQRLLEQIAAQKQHLLRRVQSAGKARRAAESSTDDKPVPAFTDPVRQLQHEVYLAWVARFSAEEKSERPLARWTVGPDFIASLEITQGVQRHTVVKVMVEVLTGVADHLGGRDSHRLRSGPGGDDPDVVRGDGAICMRVALQQNTPSARRLHYWKKGDQIEFSRIAQHDDVRP